VDVCDTRLTCLVCDELFEMEESVGGIDLELHIGACECLDDDQHRGNPIDDVQCDGPQAGSSLSLDVVQLMHSLTRTTRGLGPDG